jgi:hypothetical protein
VRAAGKIGEKSVRMTAFRARELADDGVRRGERPAGEAVMMPAEQQVGLMGPARDRGKDNPDHCPGGTAAGAAGRGRGHGVVVQAAGCLAALAFRRQVSRVHVLIFPPDMSCRQWDDSPERRTKESEQRAVRDPAICALCGGRLTFAAMASGGGRVPEEACS